LGIGYWVLGIEIIHKKAPLRKSQRGFLNYSMSITQR